MAEAGVMTDDELIDTLRREVAAWFSNVHLLEFEELIRRYTRLRQGSGEASQGETQ